MTYEEALALIHSVDWRGSRPGLSRTEELLRRLGHPERELRFVHIAGTNGKGSTAAMTASILEQAGFTVGLYTSPYLFRFNERMQVNGACIADDELAERMEKIWPLAETMEDAPTEFEITTALAMEYFRAHACDLVVLEVGLGGELDSTNVIPPPEAAVITSIGYDHTEVLGESLTEIARAKAGIIKEGCDVISGGQSPEADAVIESVCRAKGAVLHRPDVRTLRPVRQTLSGQVFDCGDFRHLEIPLCGQYQLENAALALETVRVLAGKGWRITEENIREGLRRTRWHGRLERISEHPTVLVDGSHNPPGVAATVQTLRNFFGERKLIFLIGAMHDKDVEGMLEQLGPLAEEWIAVTPDVPGRALPAEELAAALRSVSKAPVWAAGSIGAGCERALADAGRDGAVCVIGSLYLVGDATREMKKRLAGEKERRDGTA